MNYWRDIHSRQAIPPGYYAIPDVFEIIGRHMFGDAGLWTGEEVEYEDLGPEVPHPKLVFDHQSGKIVNYVLLNQHDRRACSILGIDYHRRTPLNFDEWCQARDLWMRWSGKKKALLERRHQVFWSMHRLGMSGDVGYCFINAKGAVRELDRTQWNCSFDVACDRFEHAGLNANPLYAMERPNPWNGGVGYLDHFTGELIVAPSNLQAILVKVPKIGDGRSDGNVSKRRADAFFAQAPAPAQPEAPTVLDEKPVRPVAAAKLRQWVRQQVKAGISQKKIIEMRLTAFPDNSPPSRQDVVDLDTEILSELGLPPRRKGAPKMS